jgi:hypothetical protein
MTKSAKFFRWVWRLDAILIFVAAGAITFGVGALLVTELGARSAWRQDAVAGPVVATGEGASDLVLGRASVVQGTNMMRAELVVYRPGAGFSSGGYSETRNILLIEPGDAAARWLLPDHDHVIAEHSDVVKHEDEPKTSSTVATVVLVKMRGAALEAAGGRLLLFGPSGKNIVEVADGVRTMHAATLTHGDLTVLFERDRRLFLVSFDPESLAKRHEQQMEVPQLK